MAGKTKRTAVAKSKGSKRIKVMHDTESSDDDTTAVGEIDPEHPAISNLIDNVNDYAVVAVLSSELLCTVFMAHMKKCLYGRICFTSEGLHSRNPDSIATMIVECKLQRAAFKEYFCNRSNVLVDCCMETICKRIKNKSGKGILAVITVPHSNRENGMHGPITFQFVNTDGDGQFTTMRCADTELDMESMRAIDVDYVFEFGMRHSLLKRILAQLKTDSSADRVLLTLSPQSISIENENADPSLSEKTTIETTSSAISNYNFNSTLKDFSVILSRTKLDDMLSLPFITNNIKLKIRGMDKLVTLTYTLPDNQGFIEFSLVTMLPACDYDM